MSEMTFLLFILVVFFWPMVLSFFGANMKKIPPPPGPLRPTSGPKWAKKSDYGGWALEGGVHFTKEKVKIFLDQMFPWTPGPKVRLRGARPFRVGGGWYAIHRFKVHLPEVFTIAKPPKKPFISWPSKMFFLFFPKNFGVLNVFFLN